VTIDDFKNNFHPYLYGYPVEINVTDDGGYTVNKRMAMGRVAVELAYVMPDSKTVYISDDGENCGFFMFIADQANNLTAGTLYAAKWVQTSADNGGFANIEWISLGHATQSEIRTAANQLNFSDIFETAEPNADGTAPAGFTSINAYDGDAAAHECLKLKPGMAKIASRLETRRYAAILGATVEFRKEEGITFDPDGKVLYVAMSEVARGMEDNKKNGTDNDKYDKGGPNHIKLPCNECGCVYAMDITNDTTIGSDYVAQNMYAVVCGIPTEYDGTSPYVNNTCDVDNISMPDNVTFITGYKTLIIGEDTGSGHQNDAIWSYNIEKGELTRIETTPYGSETTSPYYYPNVNGWAYIMSTVQHPFGESDQDKLADASDAKAYFGYIGPMPAMD
jgi:secreted PhoX family phosphatase